MTPEDVLITMGVVFGVCVLWGPIWGPPSDAEIAAAIASVTGAS